MSDFGVVPDGWEVRRLGDVAGVDMGQSPPSSTYNVEKEGLPFYQGTADFGNKYPATRFWCSKPAKIAEKNSILFSVRAPVGDVNLTCAKCCIGRGLSAITGKNANTFFLYQYFQQYKDDLQLLSQGSTFEAINGSELKGFLIRLPTLPEQKKIAEILTSVDEVIEKTEAQISKLRDLKKAMMTELLTKGIGHTEFKGSPVGRIPAAWKVFNVGDFLQQRKEKGEGELPLYSVLLEGGMVPRSSVERRVKSELDAGDNLTVRKGDLAYNMMRMWQGASGIGPVDCLVSPAYVVAAPDLNLVTSAYLGFLMKSSKGIRLLHRYSYGLTGDRLRLYFDSFEKIKFALPPVAEQEKIANVLFSIDERLKTKKQKLTQTKTLKKALMHDLLTGKKRVKVAVD